MFPTRRIRKITNMSRSILALLVVILFVGCQPAQSSLNSDLSIGSSFPNIEGTDLDGQPISIQQFKGKVILLDFFGDW